MRAIAEARRAPHCRWLAALAGLAISSGGVPALVPSSPLPPEMHAIVRLEGTVWKGLDSDGHQYTFRFKKGGKLNYTSPSGTFENGTWQQHGDRVYMEMNQKYAEYRGVIQGNRIDGKSSNRVGHKWTWKVWKQ